MEISKDYAIQMRGITKIFGSFCALDKVDLNVKRGTIHSLLGENGAGKSTLMNILYGLYKSEEGEIYINGKKVDIKNPLVAIGQGIGMVHQHFMLVDNFTVMQNIILGREVTKSGFILDNKKAKKEILEIVNKYGLKVDPDVKIEDISVGMQQRVEILKALYRGAEILILDEPTAVLTPQEIQDLGIIMRNLTKVGKTVIIITHKLKEILQTADTCTIIRKGEYIDTVDVKNIDEQSLATKMVGHEVKLVVDKTQANPKETIFEINNLKVKDKRGIKQIKDLNLTIKKGEILGIAGIDGNGQKELIEAITNLKTCKSGEIKINKNNVENTSTKNTIDKGICTIHDDRHRRGLVLNFSVSENMVIEKYAKKPYSNNGFLNREAINNFTDKMIKEYDIRPSGCSEEPIRSLSGGNQQKVVIAREVENNPDLLIAVQPTRGLDVGAIEYVHKTLIRERDKGKAILLISYELDEILNVSDTIAVLYAGEIVKTFKQGELDSNEVGLLMAGGTNKNADNN